MLPKRIAVICLLLPSLFVFTGNIQAEEGAPSEKIQPQEESVVVDTVLVTATRSEKLEIEIPASTQVFTTEDMEEMGAKTLVDVLRSIPDFTMTRSPSGNGSPGFRGITGHLAFLVNGIPLTNEGYIQLGTFATSGIERVEIVKGGSAVQYGSDATTGVVNIITQKDGDNTISVGAGNHEQRKVGTFLSAKGFSIALDYYKDEDRGVIYSARGIDYYGDEQERINLSMNYELNDHVNFMYLHSNRQSASTPYSSTTGALAGPTFDNEQVYDVGHVSYKNDGLQMVVYAQNRKWDYVYTTEGKQKGQNYGADVQNEWNFEQFSLTAGGDFDYEKSSRYSGSTGVENTRNKGALFLMAETDLFTDTQLLAGAREVISEDSGNVFCPQLQILQPIGEKSNLYLNINRSLKEPTLLQLYGYTATQEPNEDLESEIGWTYEIGWKKSFSSANSLEVALFHMMIEDRIYSTTTADGKTIYMNAEEFRNTGAELSFSHDPGIGLFYGAGLYYGTPEQKTQSQGEWEDTDSKFGMNANLGYRADSFMLNLMVHHSSDRADDFDDLWDVSLASSYNITEKDKVSLNIYNVLDRDDYLTAGVYTLLEERSFMLTYQHTF